ncbi:MAG: hypothetical protein RIC38_15760, partial [Chromatocurvus sp.]
MKTPRKTGRNAGAAIGAVMALGLSTFAHASVTDTWRFDQCCYTKNGDDSRTYESSATGPGIASVSPMSVTATGWYDNGSGISNANDSLVQWSNSGFGLDRDESSPQ